MCLSPIVLQNPYYNRGLIIDNKKVKTKGKFDYLHDTISKYVTVPCGQCSQCIATRQNFYVQRIQMESLRSELFYFTLTYANRGLSYTDKCGVRIAYPNYEDIQRMFKRLRKILPHPILTFVVSEYGTQRHRPHFHGFIAVNKDDIKKHYRSSHLYCEKVLFRHVLAEWKRNLSKSTKYPVWMKLCDFVVKGRKRSYDLHWIEPIINHDNDTSYYVTKYLIQPDAYISRLLFKLKMKMRHDAYSPNPEFDIEDYKEVISQIKPRAVMSKAFGDYSDPLISKHIKRGIGTNKTIPTFIDINTGKTMLLSPYYRKHCISVDYYFDRWWQYLLDVQYKNFESLGIDSYNPEYLDEDTIHELNVKSYQARKKIYI